MFSCCSSRLSVLCWSFSVCESVIDHMIEAGLAAAELGAGTETCTWVDVPPLVWILAARLCVPPNARISALSPGLLTPHLQQSPSSAMGPPPSRGHAMDRTPNKALFAWDGNITGLFFGSDSPPLPQSLIQKEFSTKMAADPMQVWKVLCNSCNIDLKSL